MSPDFLEFLTQRNSVGIFEKGESNYLLIFRNVEGPLKLAYYLTGKIRETLRTTEVQQRISYDNKKPPVQATKGQGKGKAQAGNQAKVKAIKAEATKEGRGNTVAVAHATWDRWEQPPIPQHMRIRLLRKLGHPRPQMGPLATNR